LPDRRDDQSNGSDRPTVPRVLLELVVALLNTAGRECEADRPLWVEGEHLYMKTQTGES